MSGHDEELMQRHLDGCATPEESSALQETLKENAELRARYLDYVNLDVALSALADAAAVEEEIPNVTPMLERPRFQWRAFAAAAAVLASVFVAGLLIHRKPSPARPDLAAAIASTEKAIAQMPVPPSSPLPEWISPTASMLEPPKGFQ